jgi:mono/diheme cytochrome c family protein
MKRIGWAAGAAVVLAAALVVTVWWHNYRDGVDISDASPLTAPLAAQVARGAYLARAGNCAGCHTARGGAPYAGGRGIETPFGTVYASNLTPDASGLGGWNTAAFWRAMHHGRSRDGRLLYPAFPYANTTLVAREDSDALFAYLRSLPPVAQANRAHDLRWPFNTQAALAVWRALYFRAGVYASDTSRPPAWNRGAYLVRGLGHCSACHGARNALGATRDALDLAGGLIPMQNWYAPSLAAPAEAGVGDWAEADVVALLKTGVSPRGSATGPMAEVVLGSTQHLSDADLAAMATYLKALPQTAAAPTAAAPGATGSAGGAQLYERHCAQCHGERGEGVPGAYPPLAGNRAVVMPSAVNLVQTVLGGGFAPATAGNPRPFGMPPFVLALNEREVAAVISHIRSAWGNRAEPVSEFDVQRVRAGQGR